MGETMNNYLIGLEGMQSMLSYIGKPLDSFKKKNYQETFNRVYEHYVPVMNAIEEVYGTVKEPETFLHNMAQALVDTAVQQYESVQKRSKRDAEMMDLNLVMAVYVFPVLLHYKGNSSRPLVDEVLLLWKEAFPKSNLQAAEYEYIEKGFHKKFCYITTAVCETFHKPDDCYELTLLRDYRDHYLAPLPEGRRLIRDYYDVAPTIVKHISRRSDSAKIYKSIWDDYLAPCIAMIENGDNEACKEHYIRMVETLREQYFYLPQGT